MLILRVSVAVACLAAVLAGPAAAAPPAGTATGSVVGQRAVTAPPDATPAVAAAAATDAPARAPATGTTSVADAAAPPPTSAARAASVADAPPPARAAASRGVRIVDFAYSPASIAVNVGDTIAWTNEDATPHTATADDGSFDIGTLARGASGSHTFASAGSFSYHCTIHPSMRATVTISDSAAATSPAPASPTPAAPAPAAAAGSTLPITGADVLRIALGGAVLLGAGLLLRSRTKPR